jgi:hypothetical protein
MSIISGVLGAVKGFFSNGVGSTVGNGVANVAALAALAPAVIWLIVHKDEAAVTFTFTYGQLALIGVVMFFLLKIIHYTRAGSPSDRL